MPRTVTLSFDGGTNHVYNNVPDSVTPDQITQRAAADFPGQKISNIDGGKSAKLPDPSMASRLMRQFGLTARDIIDGVTAPAQAIGNALGLKTSAALSNLENTAGLPQPKSATERFSHDVVGSMAGAATGLGIVGAMKGAISPVAQGVGRVLSSQPAMQVGSAAAGGAAAGTTREMGGGPAAQGIAGLAGAIAPQAVQGLGSAAIRGSLGGDSQSALRRVQQFKDAGTTPSVGQAFQSHGDQATESFLTRNPGSHGTMRDFAMKQAADMKNKVDETASILAGKTSPMVAGRAIEQGIVGDGGFLDRFKTVSGQLFGKLDEYLPAKKPVPVSNTQAMFAKLTTPTKGAEETTKLLVNAKVLQISHALKTDLGGTAGQTLNILGPDGKPISTVTVGGSPAGNTIPYGALKDLRSKVGELLGDSSLTSDIPRRQLKALYAGISQDMGEAVAATGNPQAVKIFNRANAYTRAGHDRIDNILQPIIDRDAPEKIFQAALSGSKEGDTTIRSVMQSLPPAAQKITAATVLRKLGKATSGNQNAEGDTFSIQTYLTNWNNLSPESKRSLFSRFGPSFTKSLDQIAKTSSDIVTSGKVYANPSGTAPTLTLQHTVGGTVLLLLTGHPGIAGAIVAESYGSNQAAKLMTNPAFVKWLAKATTAPQSSAPVLINQLIQTASRAKDPAMMNFAKALSFVSPSASQKQ